MTSIPTIPAQPKPFASSGANTNAQSAISLSGFNVLLMGPSGTGKTTAIGSLVDAGVDTFYLDLDNSLESLIGYFTDRGKPVPDNLHWHTIAPPDANFATAIERATRINTLSMKALADMVDPNRMKHNQFVKILEVLANFQDNRTGKSFGAVDKWDTSRAIVIDGMTGISNAAMSMVIGNKPVRSQADWGLAMDEVYKLIAQLCTNCKCHYVQIAHVEREMDPTFGGTKIMLSTLGNKLAPKIPQLFSDVILAVRQGDKWTWDTANPQADLKTRNLAYRSDLPPDFRLIHKRWSERQGLVS